LNILIVKLSSLGDVVHAMAALQDIRQAHPDAHIDWVVERSFAPLVRRCKGVRRVIPCELRRWRKDMFSQDTRAAWRLFKLELQSQAYDAVIDLQGLTKSALVAWLAALAPGGQRYAMANQTDGSSFEAPTRWVASRSITLPAHSHAVTRARLLCAQALGYHLPFEGSFGLLAHTHNALTAIKNIAFKTGMKGLVAFAHGTSRTDKQWPLAHWQALGQRLNAAGYLVALLHGSPAEQEVSQQIAQALAQAQVWPLLALDDLLDSLALCSGLIGVDSGLSHVAVALNLAHVQIYNFDTAWRTGPLPTLSVHGTPLPTRQCSVFAQPCPTVDAVWQAWQSVSRNDARLSATAPGPAATAHGPG